VDSAEAEKALVGRYQGKIVDLSRRGDETVRGILVKEETFRG